MTTPRLQDHHLADLRSSGLSDETIQASGCYSAPEATVRELLGFGVGPGLVFPFPGTEDSRGVPFVQVKPDVPPEWMDGHAKYLTRKDGGCRLYIPPILPKEKLTDARVPLSITEGAKKALKATQEGLACIALAGTDAWKDHRSGKSAPIADLDRIEWKGRTVYVCYDSDLATKPAVRFAEFRLARELRERGADVYAIRIPSGPNGEKVGLDDYLSSHSIDAFCAIEPEPIHHPAKEQAVPAFPVLSLGEFVTRELPQAPDLLGAGVISQGSLCSFIGRAKLGKTWVVTHLGLTVAGLDDIFLSIDLPVRQHGPVLFINAEVTEHIFQRRLRLMLAEAERRGMKTADARRRFFPVTVRGLLRLDRKAGEEAILKLASQVKPVLILLDPIGPLHGWDENSADEMGRLLNIMLGFCAKTGAAVLFTHHSPKNTEGREEIHFGRGSSVFGDRVDSALSLMPYGEQAEGSRLKLSFILRNGPPRDGLVLYRDKDEFLYRAVGQGQNAAEWLQALITEEGEIGRENAWEKFRAAGLSGEWYFRKAIDSLEKVGGIHRAPRGFPKRTFLIAGPTPSFTSPEDS
jgi:hypothetical protein